MDRLSCGVKLLKFCSTAIGSHCPKSRMQTEVPPYIDALRRPVCGSSFWTSKQVYKTSCGRSIVSRCLRAVRRGQSVTSLSLSLSLCLSSSYSSRAQPCPQWNASVLERLPSSTHRKDRCSVVSFPIQWI